MKWIERAFIAHLLVVALILGMGYAFKNFVAIGVISVLLIGIWYFANVRNKPGLEAPLLLLIILAVTAGAYFFILPNWLAVIAVTVSLGAWDLDFFLQRLRLADRLDNDAALGRDHLRRLLITEGIGLLFGLLAISLQLQISFWWTMLLLLIIAIAVNRLIKFLRQEAG